MKSDEIYRVKSIGELHEIVGAGKPRHPLITIIDYSKVDVADAPESARMANHHITLPNGETHCTKVILMIMDLL